MSTALVIPLRSWQDPQGDVILVYSEHECSVLFACWQSPGEPADYIACLSFQHAAAARSFRREFCPYELPEHREHSYIIRVQESDLLRDHFHYRERTYPGSPGADPLHFVVVGHDIYHEVLAVGFSESTIPLAEVTDPRLASLQRNA